MDKIFINGLRVNTVIGCCPEERSRPQQITLDLEIHLDLSRAALSDDLADTVDYAALESRIFDLVRQSEFRMIEGLAGAVGRLVLEYPPVVYATVRVDKPGGARYAHSAAVELTVRREETLTDKNGVKHAGM